jgi:hypothetical protein
MKYALSGTGALALHYDFPFIPLHYHFIAFTSLPLHSLHFTSLPLHSLHFTPLHFISVSLSMSHTYHFHKSELYYNSRSVRFLILRLSLANFTAAK